MKTKPSQNHPKIRTKPEKRRGGRRTLAAKQASTKCDTPQTPPAMQPTALKETGGYFAVEGIGAAAVMVERWSKPWLGEGVDFGDAIEALYRQVNAAKKGEMKVADELLVSQAVTLNVVFNEMLRRALPNLGHYPQAVDLYMRIGLRAQSQCRATLESLANIKAAPPIFAKNANVVNGQQQINNGAVQAAARAEAAIVPNKLLENPEHGKRLDIGAASTPGAGNPPLATVEAQHRTAHGQRKANRRT